MSNTSVASIILAAGKGTRINSKDRNKVSYPFLEKPMIIYGVELFERISEPVIVVVGAFAESVKEVLKNYPEVVFVTQKEQLGTGHAVKVGLEKLKSNPPDLVLVGMGDHMMFYKKRTLEKLIELHKDKQSMVTFVTTRSSKPDELAWGRVERNKKEEVTDIIEQKDANEKQRKIKELNTGLYCFDYKFLKSEINKIKKSPVTNEYYLTDIILRAVKDGLRVEGMPIRFREVGIGINRQEDLLQSQNLFKKLGII